MAEDTGWLSLHISERIPHPGASYLSNHRELTDHHLHGHHAVYSRRTSYRLAVDRPWSIGNIALR